jgi:hypothetical protein
MKRWYDLVDGRAKPGHERGGTVRDTLLAIPL